MRSTYYPPTHRSEHFHCIHCNVYAKQHWSELFVAGSLASIQSSQCSHCIKRSFWYEGKMIIPQEAPVETPHPDLPPDCLTEYNEARAIFARSPRAAAALLRLCIQKLLPHLGESGKNINEDVKSLVLKGLPSLVQKALDYCRVVGNNAVHPGWRNRTQ